MSEVPKTNPILRWFLIGVVIIIALWIGSGYFIHSYSYDNRGSFGDMFGAINALFSGIALVGIVLSIYFQNKELGNQKEEMRLTRQEFQHSRFTNVIFKKISFINDVLNDVRLENPNNQVPSMRTTMPKTGGIPYLRTNNEIINIKGFLNATICEYDFDDDMVQEANDIMLEANIIKFYDLYDVLMTDINSLDRLLEKSKLEAEVTNELYLLYFTSIRQEVIDLSKTLSSISKRHVAGTRDNLTAEKLMVYTSTIQYYDKITLHKINTPA